MATIPSWKLERLALGELPPQELAALREQAQRDPELAAALEELEASNREILFKHPPARVAAEIERRAAAGRRPHSFRIGAMVAAPTLAAAALVAIVVLRTGPADVPGYGEQVEVTRPKGLHPHLTAYRVRGSRAEPVSDGAEARARDAVQLSYVSAGRPWGVVLSIDGRGGVTLHLPEDGATSAQLGAGGEVALPHAYELDEAPGFERFFLVTSSSPLLVSQVLESARALAARPDAMTRSLELPAGVEQASFTLRKASR